VSFHRRRSGKGSAAAPPAAALALAAGCSSSAAGGSSGGSGSSTSPILIGYDDGLTGSFAANSTEAQRGFDIALAAINKAGGIGGRQIKVITYNSQGNAQTGVTNTQRLIDQDNVIAIVGYTSSAEAEAAAKITTQASVPTILYGQNAALLDATNLFRVGGNLQTLNQAMLEQVVKAGYTKIVTVTSNDLNGQESQQSAAKIITQLTGSGPVANIPFVDGAADYTPVSLKLKSVIGSAQAVFLDGSGTDTINVMKNAATFGLTANTLWFGPPLAIPTFPSAAGDAVTAGKVFATIVDYDKPAVQDLQKTVSGRWPGETVNLFYTEGYDSAEVLAAALKQPGAANNRASLLAAMQTLKGVTALGGPPGFTISFSKGTGAAHDAYPLSAISVVQWLADGKPGAVTLKGPA
jgi:branched-chain amino acid transport system substrate-binding protein